jgi:hypothetical protein
VADRGAEEMTKGKREATKADTKDRVSAELSGPCMAYSGSAKDTASTGTAKDTATSR